MADESQGWTRWWTDCRDRGTNDPDRGAWLFDPDPTGLLRVEVWSVVKVQGVLDVLLPHGPALPRGWDRSRCGGRSGMDEDPGGRGEVDVVMSPVEVGTPYGRRENVDLPVLPQSRGGQRKEDSVTGREWTVSRRDSTGPERPVVFSMTMFRFRTDPDVPSGLRGPHRRTWYASDLPSPPVLWFSVLVPSCFRD